MFYSTEPIWQSPSPLPEPGAHPRRRRLPRFSLKSLFVLVALVAAFFAGRATNQRYNDRARALAARHAETFRKVQEFPARLKPLALPPGTQVWVSRARQWSADPIPLLRGGWVGREGGGKYRRIYEDYCLLNVAGTSIPTRSFNLPGERAGVAVNGLLDQLKNQVAPSDVLYCRRAHQVNILDGLGAIGRINLTYGTVFITAVCAADRKTGAVTDKVWVQVTTCLRADDDGQW